MNRFDAVLVASALCGGVFGCGGPGDGLAEDLGAVELRLADTPADARCLRIVVEGARSKTSLLSLTPGSAADLLLDRVPVGLVTLDAAAFDLACTSVSASSVPVFVTESPIALRVSTTGVSQVRIHLVRNGRLGIDVDFSEAEAADHLPLELAVIGDAPYGAEQVESFGRLVEHINQQPQIDGVVHVGDIKNGSSRCDTSYYEAILGHFSAFVTPLVYTPGDNEWTDCHRANNGAFDPLERLDVLRRTFFAEPNLTLGAPSRVLSQAAVPSHRAFVENRMWMRSSVVFATVHAVGSSNGLAAWFGTDTTGLRFDEPDRRRAEVEARTSAAVDWIERAFALASSDAAVGAVLFMQADTFAGSVIGFEPIVKALAEGARSLGKPVLLVQGDTHAFLVDQPLLAGDAAYGISEPVPGLTRVVVQGETIDEWLELRVDPTTPNVFSWTRHTLP